MREAISEDYFVCSSVICMYDRYDNHLLSEQLRCFCIINLYMMYVDKYVSSFNNNKLKTCWSYKAWFFKYEGNFLTKNSGKKNVSEEAN